MTPARPSTAGADLRITLVGRLAEDAQMRICSATQRPTVSVRLGQTGGRLVCGTQTYAGTTESDRHAAQAKARAMRRGTLVELQGTGPMTPRGGRLVVATVHELLLLDGPRGRMAAANDNPHF